MLLINEIYGPVKQGEGKSSGLDVMFLRLSGCNLACIWCDTPYTWNWKGTKFVHPDKFDPKAESHKMSVKEVKQALYKSAGNVKALVLSGGEPMLQQRKLIPLLQELKNDNWWIEVETNGTISPFPEFAALLDQINCSPKTENSGIDNPLKLRIKQQALQEIAHFKNATFKFVVQSDTDMSEIHSIMSIGEIRTEQVWLMPEGRTKKEQLLRQEQVKAIAKENGYNFSPRLHILEFGDKRAV